MTTEIASTAEITALTTTEQLELERQEAVIARGVETFVEVGNALAAIRDQRLYRTKHESFESYCRDRWEIGRSQAYRLIDAAAVVSNVSPIGDIVPSNEAQTRPLASLPPEQQREAWKEAVETMPGGKPTAAHVQQVVEARKPKPAAPPPPPAPRPAPTPLNMTPRPSPAGDQEIAVAPTPRPPIQLTPLTPAGSSDGPAVLLAKRALLASALQLIEIQLAKTDHPPAVVRQDQVDQAARLFVSSQALTGAAGLLALSIVFETAA